jgi:hypothetical protein
LDWRAITYLLAANDLYAALSERVEVLRPNKTYETNFTYDRHEGAPVLRSFQSWDDSPDGPSRTSELTVVDRQFGPISEEAFDPDRFLDGPQMMGIQPDLDADGPSLLERWYWLTFPIGALGLCGGAALSLRTGKNREGVESTQPAMDL